MFLSCCCPNSFCKIVVFLEQKYKLLHRPNAVTGSANGRWKPIYRTSVWLIRIQHKTGLMLRFTLKADRRRVLPGERSGQVPPFTEISPPQKSLLGQRSFVSTIQESTCDGSANGAAPAVPQLSYTEMKDSRVMLSSCSGLFILEDETPTKRLPLTSRHPFSAPSDFPSWDYIV